MSSDDGPVPHDPDVAVTFAATLIDQWRRRGVRHVIVSPGSRSTPLVLGLQWVLDQQAADAGDALRAHLVLDERSAAFQAVGVARAGGRPAVLMCTSGTAAVEY
ncbi:MAG: thiamine pyrophosphate-binding protein, partial [Candidatus Microthrix parvicella]